MLFQLRKNQKYDFTAKSSGDNWFDEGIELEEILFEMGFKEYEDKMNISDDYTRTVIKFNQRKLGEWTWKQK